MLKKLFFILLFVVTLLMGSVGFVLTAPYYYYNSIVNKNSMNEWFSITNHRPLLVKSKKTLNLNKEKKINEKLWKKFHFKNLEMPLPIRNPFFFVSPVLKYKSKIKETEFGISIFNADNEIISQIYFLPNMRFPYIMNKQKLFELPVVSQHINQMERDQIWKDIFSKDLKEWNISYKEMVYNLYLLQLRSLLINKRTIKYNYIENLKKGILRLEYENKDYVSDLVMSKRGNSIYSYIIISKTDNKEAQRIKYKMLKDVSFMDTTVSLADIIYQEFKALSFEQQIDHEGMLYLLSAWSHAQHRLEILVSSIHFLERGRQNQRQLEPLYNYIFNRTGKTYSLRRIEDLNLSPEILLKRNIELEAAVKKTVEEEIVEPEKALTVKEQYERILEETRNTIKKKSKTMIIN